MADLFFFASKFGWFIIAPSNALIAFVTLGWVFQTTKRFTRLGRRLLGVGVIGLALGVFTPIGDAMVSKLERRFEPLSMNVDCETVRGIIVLGGAMGTLKVGNRYHQQLNDAADRIHYAADLARRCPKSKIVLSGGQVFPRIGVPSEAEAMANVIEDLGIDLSRVTAVGRSRTTFENAVFSKPAVSTGENDNAEWLLVTSAFHMPRAVGVFRQAGFKIIAAPTDWRLDEDSPSVLVTAAGRLEALDMATKEFLGLIAYRLTDRSDALWPGPNAPVYERAQ